MHILIIEDEKRNFNRLKRLLEEIDGTFRIDGPLAMTGTDRTKPLIC